jgi:hypothetical protein
MARALAVANPTTPAPITHASTRYAALDRLINYQKKGFISWMDWMHQPCLFVASIKQYFAEKLRNNEH